MFFAQRLPASRGMWGRSYLPRWKFTGENRFKVVFMNEQDNPQPTTDSQAFRDAVGYVAFSARSLSLTDRKELGAKRGFTDQTLGALKLFTASPDDLPSLGVTVPYEKLPSTIVVPYLAETRDGKTLCRTHKTSAEGVIYAPYSTPPPTPTADIVITESELKAAIAYQLGDFGIGLQGSQSFLNRVGELANFIRAQHPENRRIFVLPDHERLIVEGKRVVYEPTIQMVRLAYSLGNDLGMPVRLIQLPDKYLVSGHTASGQPKVKADLDGCVAAGMTRNEWQALKDAAKLPWELDFPVEVIVEALAAGDPNEFFKTTLLRHRLATASTNIVVDVCRALSKALRTRSWNAAKNSLDRALYDLYCKAAVVWAKANGLKCVTLKLFNLPTDTPNADEPTELIAYCMEEGEGCVTLVKRGALAENVASFTLVSCEYGEIAYTGAEKRRRYKVLVSTIVGSRKVTRSIIIDDNLYDAEAYTKADPDLVVADPKRFKMYVGAKLQKDGFQKHNASLNQPLFVGITTVNGNLVAATCVKFPRRDQDCLYHAQAFSVEGEADAAFQEIARITPNADVVFAHMLGAPLKAVLGAYPNASMVGPRYSGKTTLAGEVEARTGLKRVSAPDQLSSRYRQLRALGNHNLAVLIDEAQRLGAEWKQALTGTLNTAYNGAATTHGFDGHYFVSGCAILLGQDRAFTDEAAETKQVVFHFSPENLNADAIRTAKANRTMFPMKRWLDFMAAKCSDAQMVLNAKQVWLQDQLTAMGVDSNGADRTLFNYAAVLVSAHYLTQFGVVLTVESKIVELCKLHLAGKLHGADEQPAATSSAQKFLADVVSAVTVPMHAQKLAGTFECMPEGVWFCLEPVFEYLKRLDPGAYDVNHAARMGEAIRTEFTAKGVVRRKHAFGQSRKNALVIPTALCAELGVEFSGGESSAIPLS